MQKEAQLTQTPGGKAPKGDGWFVLNAREARWLTGDFGAYTRFEGEERWQSPGRQHRRARARPAGLLLPRRERSGGLPGAQRRVPAADRGPGAGAARPGTSSTARPGPSTCSSARATGRVRCWRWAPAPATRRSTPSSEVAPTPPRRAVQSRDPDVASRAYADIADDVGDSLPGRLAARLLDGRVRRAHGARHRRQRRDRDGHHRGAGLRRRHRVHHLPQPGQGPRPCASDRRRDRQRRPPPALAGPRRSRLGAGLCQRVPADRRAAARAVNNAGLAGKRGTTASGFELAFGTNHVGTFLLTELLLTPRSESAPARIVNVSSEGHYRVEGIDYDAVRSPTRTRTAFHEYCVSKLANVLHAPGAGPAPGGHRRDDLLAAPRDGRH